MPDSQHKASIAGSFKVIGEEQEKLALVPNAKSQQKQLIVVLCTATIHYCLFICPHRTACINAVNCRCKIEL
jgi:hypothetical protein